MTHTATFKYKMKKKRTKKSHTDGTVEQFNQTMGWYRHFSVKRKWRG